MAEKKYQFMAKVKTATDWQEINFTGTEISRLNRYLKRFRAWKWCNVTYCYLDNFDNHACGQIASYTPRCLPTENKPTVFDISRFVERMKKTNGGKVRHFTLLAVCNYAVNELDGDLYSIGLDESEIMKFGDWQNIATYQDIAFEAQYYLNQNNSIDEAVKQAIECRDFEETDFEGGKRILIKDLERKGYEVENGLVIGW